MRTKSKQLRLLALLLPIAFLFFSLKSNGQVPTPVTSVSSELILTGSGGCHVSGYSFTANGSTGGPTYYQWQNSYDGVNYSPLNPTVNPLPYVGDQTCNFVYMRVRPCNANGCNSTWFYFDTDDCTPYDNPECIRLYKISKNAKRHTKHLK